MMVEDTSGPSPAWEAYERWAQAYDAFTAHVEPFRSQPKPIMATPDRVDWFRLYSEKWDALQTAYAELTDFISFEGPVEPESSPNPFA